MRSAANAENTRTKENKNKSTAKVTPRHCTHQKNVQFAHKYLFPPVCLLVKVCVCFYCHLTLFVRNKLIHRVFKSVRWFQNILQAPAYILHTPPRCRAVGLDVCGGIIRHRDVEQSVGATDFSAPQCRDIPLPCLSRVAACGVCRLRVGGFGSILHWVRCW